MTKTTFVALFAVAVLLTGTIAGPIGLVQSADALKSKGNSASEINSKKVCGDRLCSEAPAEEKPVEKKKKEQVKTEKKTETAEKAKEAPKKDTKAETMTAAKAVTKTPKTVTGIITSEQDPGVGHENHQLAIILPPSDKTYRGYLTYTASENVQLVALHGPLKKGMDKGQAIWTMDGKTKFGLTFVDKETSTGVWQFSGNAIAVHTKNSEPFTVSYSVTYTEHDPSGERVIKGTTTSVQDPGIGHEEHQLAVLLAPRDKAYSGHLTFDASEPVQIVTLIGPIEKGAITGLPHWTPDGETYYALSLIPTKAAGSTSFSGNALALHTFNSEPFTVSYSIVLTNPMK